MTLTMFFQIIAFGQKLAPMIPVIYSTLANMFPAGTPGAVKLAALKEAVAKAVSTVEELKPFEAILEQAWPHLEWLVTRYHQQVTAPAAGT